MGARAVLPLEAAVKIGRHKPHEALNTAQDTHFSVAISGDHDDSHYAQYLQGQGPCRCQVGFHMFSHFILTQVP